MKPKSQKLRGKIWGVLLVVLLAGCGAPATISPAPSPQALTVGLAPALQPMETALHQCALEQPELALILNETSPGSIDFQKNLVGITLGPAPEETAYSAALAEEQVAIIVNLENPVKSLTIEELAAIFSGQTRSWDAIGGEDQNISVFAAPPGNEVRQIFDAAILSQKSLSSQAFLAPDPESMLSNVASNPGAIGYIPGAWLTDRVRSLELNEPLAKALRQPVLAQLSKEPTGTSRNFLSCLQNGPGQKLIQEHYLAWK